jgi:autotransporter-associated beta strand protein
MNKPQIALFASAHFLVISHLGFAGSATWNLNPTSGDWNTAANWTPATVPNGALDVATFGSSTRTTISVATDTDVSEIVFGPDANGYAITPSLNTPSTELTISGAGITNNSGRTQNFRAAASGSRYSGIVFTNSATAGSDVVITLQGNTGNGSQEGYAFFMDAANAGSATLIVAPSTSTVPSFTFYGNSSAANCTYTELDYGDATGGGLLFFDSSTAGNGSFTIPEGNIGFTQFSTAGNATITVGNPGGGLQGSVSLTASASADQAHITVRGGGTSDQAGGGVIIFSNSATAASSSITIDGGSAVNPGGGTGYFNENSTAGDALFTISGGTANGAAGAKLTFNSNSGQPSGPTAGNATLIANGGTAGGLGGQIEFDGNSTGGTCTIKLSGNGTLTVNPVPHGDPLTIGSLEGEGSVMFDQSGTLTIGSNDLSTTFSGVIADGRPGFPGALSKIGAGNLTLAGTNTYTGGTTVGGGILLANNTNGSGTGSGPVSVTAGTFGGGGRVSGAVTVGTGSGAGAFLGPGATGVIPGTLTIRRKLTLMGDATYKVTMNSSTVTADKVSAKGVKIRGAQILLDDRATSVLPTGTVFTVINNTAATPIAGTFANLADGATVVVGSNTFQANYEGGDGNDLTLTVVP